MTARPLDAPDARGWWQVGTADKQILGLWLVLAFVALFFLFPLAKILILSVMDDDGHFTLAKFQELLSSASTRRVLQQTITTSLLVSLICLVIAYPAAVYLARLTGWRSTLCNVLILFPFLSSSLIRTFVFIVLLGRRGALNQFFEFVGVPGAPFRLLFNDIGVLIGMSYVLLPYMLLSLVGTMKRINPSLLDAALSLGASRFTVFVTVYLPLSLPGVATGVVITTILAFGYFVTPALMGGPGQMMIAQLVEQRVTTTYDLGGAAAVAILMLVFVSVTYACASRWLGLARLMRSE